MRYAVNQMLFVQIYDMIRANCYMIEKNRQSGCVS